jgi:hypothetical protein
MKYAEEQDLRQLAPATLAAFRTALYKERRLELCFEGHEWHDIVRTGRLQAVLGITDPNKSIWPVSISRTCKKSKIITSKSRVLNIKLI